MPTRPLSLATLLPLGVVALIVLLIVTILGSQAGLSGHLGAQVARSPEDQRRWRLLDSWAVHWDDHAWHRYFTPNTSFGDDRTKDSLQTTVSLDGVRRLPLLLVLRAGVLPDPNALVTTLHGKKGELSVSDEGFIDGELQCDHEADGCGYRVAYGIPLEAAWKTWAEMYDGALAVDYRRGTVVLYVTETKERDTGQHLVQVGHWFRLPYGWRWWTADPPFAVTRVNPDTGQEEGIAGDILQTDQGTEREGFAARYNLTGEKRPPLYLSGRLVLPGGGAPPPEIQLLGRDRIVARTADLHLVDLGNPQQTGYDYRIGLPEDTWSGLKDRALHQEEDGTYWYGLRFKVNRREYMESGLLFEAPREQS